MEITMKVLKTLSHLYVNDLNPALEFYEELLALLQPGDLSFLKSAWNSLR
jgi:GTP:adenosylcobinamide-phosphate guanylyltransferase